MSPNHPLRRSDDDNITLPMVMSKSLAWAIVTMLGVTGGLLAWLCVSTMALKEQNAVLIERTDQAREQSKIFHQELERLTLTDARLSLELKNLQIAAARHGWKDSND